MVRIRPPPPKKKVLEPQRFLDFFLFIQLIYQVQKVVLFCIILHRNVVSHVVNFTIKKTLPVKGGLIFLLTAVFQKLLKKLVHTGGCQTRQNAANQDADCNCTPVCNHRKTKASARNNGGDVLVFHVINPHLDNKSDYQASQSDFGVDLCCKDFHFVSSLVYSFFQFANFFHDAVQKPVPFQVIMVNMVHPFQIFVLLNGYPLSFNV